MTYRLYLPRNRALYANRRPRGNNLKIDLRRLPNGATFTNTNKIRRNNPIRNLRELCDFLGDNFISKVRNRQRNNDILSRLRI